MSYYKMRTTKERLLEGLQGIGAWIYHESRHGSVYIKFSSPKIGSLRLGDHIGRTKYKYRWNIGPHLKTGSEHDRGVNRHYYHSDDVEDLINHILNYSHKVYKSEKKERRSSGITFGDAGGGMGGLMDWEAML